MTVGIMQPYIFPYIGYFQLMANVDKYVIYDNIQYTKKGWINRNRILFNGSDRLFSIPLKKDSDYKNVIDREISPNWERDRIKFLNVIKASYRKAPYFEIAYPVIEECIMDPERNLFRFIYNSIKILNKYMEIDTEVIISSTINIDHEELKGQDKVLKICKELGATGYINAIGGTNLYDKEAFSDTGIKLNFIKPDSIEYDQFSHKHVAWLSIIDIMMFNNVSEIKKMLTKFTLI